jgi:hypothetical protein
MDLLEFIVEHTRLIAHAKELSDSLSARFAESANVYLNEADAGITNQGQDWPLISVSYDKSKILACTDVPPSRDFLLLYEFNEEKHRIMREVCYLFGLPPEQGWKAVQERGVTGVEVLYPPTLDTQVERFLSLDETRQALEAEDRGSQTLRHTVFLLHLKARRDGFRAVLERPSGVKRARVEPAGGATPGTALLATIPSDLEQAAELAKLWLPLRPEDIDHGVTFLCERTEEARQIADRAAAPGAIKCPHCRQEFPGTALTAQILQGESLVQGFSTAVGLSRLTEAWPYVCPRCVARLDVGQLAPGESYISKPLCFVASAVFSPASSEVAVLQGFRDQCLLKSAVGRLFVRSYYRCGPWLAAIVSRSSLLRRATRRALGALVRCWAGSRLPPAVPHRHTSTRISSKWRS